MNCMNSLVQTDERNRRIDSGILCYLGSRAGSMASKTGERFCPMPTIDAIAYAGAVTAEKAQERLDLMEQEGRITLVHRMIGGEEAVGWLVPTQESWLRMTSGKGPKGPTTADTRFLAQCGIRW